MTRLLHHLVPGALPRLSLTRWQTLRQLAVPGLLALAVGCDGNTGSMSPSDDASGPGGASPDGPGTAVGDDPPVLSAAAIASLAPGPRAGRTLDELPDPPATPPPGPEHEPERADPATHTITEFFLVQDAGPPIVDPDEGLDDADFEAGPLPPRVYTLPGAPVEDNRAPDFVDLTDQEVLAGDTLELLLEPVDPDGGLPGMFPASLPDGAQLRDNLDGTKSLVWRPLQPDVGVVEFMITAIDPVEPRLRTERTVRIRVSLPPDPSSIRNLAPGINEVRLHTVRLGDPVVIEIKGTDPNGIAPILGIDNPPVGAVFAPHYRDPDISLLRFTPRQLGEQRITVTATDADDPDLGIERDIVIDVRAADEFQRPGRRLRELAVTRDVRIGFAALQNFYHRPDGRLYADIAAEEFDLVTTENSLKWDLVNPLPGEYQWASADNLVRWAETERLGVHAHTLVWHRQLPSWIRRSEPEQRELHMREYIDRVLGRYRDRIGLWDVVNEALEEDGSLRQSVWSDAMGADFIDIAFRQARASAPDATLIYNDYDIAWRGPKSLGLLQLLGNLKTLETPIDGVGFQLHVFASFDQVDEVREVFREVAALDLDIYITEADVSMAEGDTPAMQAAVYEALLSVCLEEPRCRAFQTWGFTDMYSWRREFSPLLLDEAYQIKPAYLALQRRLGELR